MSIKPTVHQSTRPESQLLDRRCSIALACCVLAAVGAYFGASRLSQTARIGITVGAGLGAGVIGAICAQRLRGGASGTAPQGATGSAAGAAQARPAAVQGSDPVQESFYAEADGLARAAQVEFPLLTDADQIAQVRRAGWYGQGLGDAVGVPCEFLTREQAQKVIGEKFEFNYQAYARDWVARFEPNGFSDDTEQSHLIARALIVAPGDYAKELARQFTQWGRAGFTAGDGFVGPTQVMTPDVGNTTRASIAARGFTENPVAAVRALWEHGDAPFASRSSSNGALMRTSVISLFFANDLSLLVAVSVETAKVTHANPQCIASCVALNVAMALIMRGATSEQAIFHAGLIAGAVHDEECSRYPRIISADDTAQSRAALRQAIAGPAILQELQLGQRPIGFTYKTLAAAFWGLREAAHMTGGGVAPNEIYRTVLQRVVGEGGDTDTNGAPTGALVAVFLQQRNRSGDPLSIFPATWIRDMARKEVMDDVLGKMPPLVGPEATAAVPEPAASE